MNAALAAATGELALAGTRRELRELADTVGSGSGTVPLSTAGDSGAYETRLSRLEIETVERPTVRVAADPGTATLHVSGSRDTLRVLAENLRSLAGTPHANDHLHVEYFPEHFYLDPESAPLVVENTD